MQTDLQLQNSSNKQSDEKLTGQQNFCQNRTELLVLVFSSDV